MFAMQQLVTGPQLLGIRVPQELCWFRNRPRYRDHQELAAQSSKPRLRRTGVRQGRIEGAATHRHKAASQYVNRRRSRKPYLWK